MDSKNILFIPTVRSARAKFGRLESVGERDNIYPSKHFFERVVERNLDRNLSMIHLMATRAFEDMQASTYNHRTYKVVWGSMVLHAMIGVGKLTNKRQLVLKTIYDRDTHFEYDVLIKI